MSQRTGKASVDAPPGRTLEGVLRIGLQANIGLDGDPRILRAEENDAAIEEKLKELIERVYDPLAFPADKQNIYTPEEDIVQLDRLQTPGSNDASYTVAFRYVFTEFKLGEDQLRSMQYRLVLNGKDTSLKNAVGLGTRSQPLSKEGVLKQDMVSYSPRFWKDLLKDI